MYGGNALLGLAWKSISGVKNPVAHLLRQHVCYVKQILDIVSHKVGSKQTLEEIHVACGGDYGSNQIDKKIFENFIYNI